MSDCMAGFRVSRSMLSYNTLVVNGVAGSISSKVGMESGEMIYDADAAMDVGAPLDDVESRGSGHEAVTTTVVLLLMTGIVDTGAGWISTIGGVIRWSHGCCCG